jgi:HEAT repeat protein
MINLSSCFIIALLLISCIIGAFGQTDQMKKRILSTDYDVAERALEENMNQRDVKAVCLSLKHRAPSLRIKAAEALGSIRSKEAVNCLTEALKGNQTFTPVDTESTVLRDRLNRSLIEALSAITGLNLPIKKKYSYVEDAEIEKIIRRIKEWQKSHPSR